MRAIPAVRIPKPAPMAVPPQRALLGIALADLFDHHLTAVLIERDNADRA